MLDWIFEGIVTWVSSIASELMDAVSRVFLDALGTDMDAMEGYFPFVTKAFEVMQYMAWAVLFLITVWQLFRVFGGPITEAENPWQLPWHWTSPGHPTRPSWRCPWRRRISPSQALKKP